MSPHSYNWHQAQVCMSLARATDDPSLKRRFETLALNFLEKDDTDLRGLSEAAVTGKTGPSGGAASADD